MKERSRYVERRLDVLKAREDCNGIIVEVTFKEWLGWLETGDLVKWNTGF